jgi:hypothetical protein
MTTTTTHTVPPRGPEYDRRVQRLLKQGALHRIGTSYLILSRPVSLHSHNTFEYGYACLACETVTWDKTQVSKRECPVCSP